MTNREQAVAGPAEIQPGIDGRAGAHALPSHALLLHEGGDSCTDAVRSFLGDETPGGILAVVSPETHDMIAAVIGPGAVYEDVTRLGRNPARVIPVIRRFVEANARHRPIRVVTEQWWDQRELAERAELARHEALANLAFARVDVELVCLYDVRQIRPEIVSDARSTHPLLADRYGVCLNDGYVDPETLLQSTETPLEPPPPSAEVFDVRSGALSGLRAAVERRGRSAGLPAERVEDLVLAVNELATNVVSHGRGEGRLQIWDEGSWLVCDVADRGRVDDPFIGTRPPRAEDTGGRGLWIVNQLCDLVELRSSPSGTAVRLRFARPSSATAPAPSLLF